MLAIYGRPDTWNWLLLFHILSAVLVFAGAIVIMAASLAALRAVAERALLLRRVALRTSLLTILPYIGIHIFGGVLTEKEYTDLGRDEPGWLGAAWGLTALYGIISIILLSLLQWWVVRRTRGGGTLGWQEKLATWLAPVGPALLLVVLFLMSGKPGQ